MNTKDFKRIIKDRYAVNPDVKGVKISGDDFDTCARLDYGAFEQCVTLVPMQTEYNQNYDEIFLTFKVDNFAYSFSIYQLFSLYEIDDFNSYSFSLVLNEESLNNILDIFDKLTGLYYSHLKDISSSTKIQNRLSEIIISDLHFEKVENNPEFDKIKKDALNEAKKPDSCIYDCRLYTKQVNKNAPKSKIIRKLERKSAELTEFERRVLVYLKSGGEAPKCIVVSKTKSLNALCLKAFVPILVLGFAPLYYFFIRLLAVFGSGYIPPESLKFSIILQIISSVLFITFLFTAFLNLSVKLTTPKEFQEQVYEKIKYDIRNRKIESKVFSKIVSIFVIVFTLIICVATTFMVKDNIAFYDDFVKFDNMDDKTKIVLYEDLTIYELEGDLEDDKFVETQGYYLLVDNDNDYYLLTGVNENSKTHKVIFERLEENNLKLNHAKTKYDIEGINK